MLELQQLVEPKAPSGRSAPPTGIFLFNPLLYAPLSLGSCLQLCDMIGEEVKEDRNDDMLDISYISYRVANHFEEELSYLLSSFTPCGMVGISLHSCDSHARQLVAVLD